MWRGDDDELFDEDTVVAKGGFRLVSGRAEAVAHFVVVPGYPHALAAAAGRRLDHHRIADLRGDLDGLVGVLDQAHMAGHGGNACPGRQLLRRDLVAHGFNRLDRRADEGDAFLDQRFGEFGAFRQETVARMDGLGARLAHGVHDLVDDDIGLVRPAAGR